MSEQLTIGAIKLYGILLRPSKGTEHTSYRVQWIDMGRPGTAKRGPCSKGHPMGCTGKLSEQEAIDLIFRETGRVVVPRTTGTSPTVEIATIGFGSMVDDFGAGAAGQRKGTKRKASVVKGTHNDLHARTQRQPGDELVTADDGWQKVVADCVKVERRGYGRVVIDAYLDDEFSEYLDGKFPTVPRVTP